MSERWEHWLLNWKTPGYQGNLLEMFTRKIGTKKLENRCTERHFAKKAASLRSNHTELIMAHMERSWNLDHIMPGGSWTKLTPGCCHEDQDQSRTGVTISYPVYCSCNENNLLRLDDDWLLMKHERFTSRTVTYSPRLREESAHCGLSKIVVDNVQP